MTGLPHRPLAVGVLKVMAKQARRIVCCGLNGANLRPDGA